MDTDKLDALIAERVMGWTLRHDEIAGKRWAAPDGTVYTEGRWHPSTDIAQAWQVVERMYSLGYPAEIKRRPYRRTWECQFDGLVNAEASTAPLAICLAALRALGVEVE